MHTSLSYRSSWIKICSAVLIKVIWLSPILFPSSATADDVDTFSRANCFNNESITYNYFDPPESRGVFSHHFKNGTRKHYVTERAGPH